MENKKPPIEEENAALISLEQVPATEVQLEQLRQKIGNEIEEKIAAFRADDSKIDAIAAQFNLQNQADVFAAKSEINFDHQLREINTEAENTRSEALAELSAEEANADSTKEADINPEHDPAQEKYEKEILPMLQILKPDNVPLEAYEAEMMNELFEDAKKLQVAQGKMIENPESTMHDIKVMLHERVKAYVDASHDYTRKDRPKEDDVRKAKIALMFEGDLSDVESYFGGKERMDIENIELSRLQSYIGNNMTKSELDGLMKTSLAQNIISKSDAMYFHYGRTEGLPESVLVAAAKLSDDSGSMYRVIKDALERADKGEFSEVAYNTLIENGRAEYVVKYLEAFKNVDPDALVASGIFTGQYVVAEINHVKRADIDPALKKTILDKGLVSFLNKGNFYSFDEIVGQFGIDTELLRTPEMQDAVLSGLKHFISEGRWSETKRILEIMDIPADQITTPEFSEIAHNSLARHVSLIASGGSFAVENLIEFSERFNIDQDILKQQLIKSLPDIVQVAGVDTSNILKKFDLTEAFEIPEVKAVLTKQFREYATQGNFFRMENLKNQFPYLQAEMDSPELKQGVQASFEMHIAAMNIHKLEEYTSAFPFLKENYGTDIFDMGFDQHVKKLDLLVSPDGQWSLESKIKRTENLKEAFHAKYNKEKLPPIIAEKMDLFENQYGPKGKNLIALAIAAYGTSNPEAFAREMGRIESVLNKYDPSGIPDGSCVSMGIEYEATSSIGYDAESEAAYGYKKDAELISHAAGIGKGLGGIHEFAPKPTYNPYMLIAEVRLMQEAGLFDLNFTKYEKAPRGYHLSLGGDSGLKVNEDMHFLNNAMTIAQLSGVIAGKEVVSARDIYQKQLEHFSDTKQGGVRCEIKGMATDSVEQFEKAILTAHHAGVAMQVSEKYLPSHVQFAEVPDTADSFEDMLVTTGAIKDRFNSAKEKEIVFEWAKLKRDIMDAVSQHNASFVESEFGGGFVDKKGEYVDTGEHIDISRNKKLISEEELTSNEFKKSISIRESWLFETQQPEFINALVRTNNIFLKGPQGTNNSSVNAKAVLDVMKHENYGGIMDGRPQDSLFDRGGEVRDGYYVVQGASEEMITHKSQILLNKFNREMERLLQQKEAVVSENEYATAGEYAQE